MKAVTVQQPWAWAIVRGGKDVENRTQAWGYRGPLAIHAGRRWSERGAGSPLMRRAVWDFYGTESPLDEPRFCSRESPRVFGAIIGVAQLVDVHVAHGEVLEGALRKPHCCDSLWAEMSYDEHGGGTRRELVHLVLEEPVALSEPVACRGALGLWTPSAEVTDAINAQLAAA